MSCFPLPYGITDAQWHISHFSGCIAHTPQVCQRCNQCKGRHTPTHIYTYTQHTQGTHKVHLGIYSVVCAVQGTHTTCQASHIPCFTLQNTRTSAPGQLHMAVSLLVSLCCLGAVTLNYPGEEAVPHLHQMVFHINITVK